MKERILGERFSIISPFFESNNIFEATDMDTDEKVLVKIVSMLPKDMKRWTKFENELKIINQLNHPGIIKIKEWGDCEGGKYIAFEHIDGVRLSEAKLSVSSSIRTLLRVAEALKAMHDVELIHRDFKPENIVLYDQTNLLTKFFDFGSSASEETKLRQIKPNEIIRTLSWISPEALRNEPVTLSSNLYQFGLLSYQLLTSQTPYKEDTPSSLIWQIQHMNPLPASSINPRIPIPLENAIKRLLRKDPETRFETIDEVIDILRELAKQENISSTFSIRTGLLLGRGRIVGRSKETTKLSLSLKEQHGFELYHIHGALGIGKTRLLQEIESQARITDIPTISIGCDEQHKNRNLCLIGQVVQECVGQLGIGTIGKSPFKKILTRLSPGLGERIISSDTAEIDEYELERQAIPALRWLFESIAKNYHLLLIIDDIEHADSQSLKILEKLYQAISDLAVTMIITSQTDLRMEVTNKTRLDLEPLTRKDVSLMLHESLGFSYQNEEFTDLAFDISKGNPLILELIISGIATNRGIDDSGKLILTSDKIPRTIDELLKWQLPKLSQSVLDVLSVAAVVGNTFDEASLEKITGKSKHEIADSLDMGMLANIISHYKSPSGYRYRFVTDKMTELLQEKLSQRQRTLIHEDIIKQIMLSQERDEQIWILIDHLKNTGNNKLLVEQLIKASKMVATDQDNEKSIEVAKDAYKLAIKSADTTLETIAVINLAQCYKFSGELDKSLELLEGIMKTAKKIGIDQLSESDLLFEISMINAWQGNLARSQDLSQECFKIISRIGDDERLVKLHSLESFIYVDQDPELSLRQSQKAISLLDKYPNNEYARQCYNMLAQAYIQNGNIEAARQAIAKAKDCPKNSNNLLYHYNTYTTEAELAILEGNVQLASEIISNVTKEPAFKYSVPVKIGINMTKASVLALSSKYDDAINLLQETVSMNLQLGSKYYAAKTLIRLCRTFIDSGRLDGAKYSIFQAENMSTGHENFFLLNSLSILKAQVHLMEGEDDKCLQLLGDINYIKLSPFDKITYKIMMAQVFVKKGDYKKSLSQFVEEGMATKQILSLPSISCTLNLSKAGILMSIIDKTRELTLPQKTILLSKNGMLGQDLAGMAKQALDLAYVNTLYSGDSTQQPKASFALAKYHCLMLMTDSGNAQFHRDECARLIEMTNALANDLNMSTLIMRAQNLELALKTGKTPIGI